MKNKIKSERVIIFLFIFFIANVSVAIFFASYSIREYSAMLQGNLEKRLVLTAQEAANLLTAEDLKLFVSTQDMQKYEYKEIQKALAGFSSKNNLVSTKFFRRQEERIQCIFDSTPNLATQWGLDDFSKPDETMLLAFSGTSASGTLGEYEPGKEGILTAYAPVRDKRGRVAAVASVEFSDAEIIGIKKRTDIITVVLALEIIAFLAVSAAYVFLFRKKAQAFQEASLAKSQFLSRMSHEIRTPMNAIIGFCRMAKDSEEIPQIREYLTNINNSSQFLLQLINGILDISKIEAGKLVLQPEKMSVERFVERLSMMMQGQAEAKKLHLSIKAGHGMPPAILCDTTRLTQVMVNLLSNAIKFTLEGGMVRASVSLLAIEEGKCKLEFEVSDSGIGIEAKNLATLFEPFEQADGSITRKYGGTGLGLTISKLLVEMMGGTFRVDSMPGHGSTFAFDAWFEILAQEDGPPEDDTAEKAAEEKAPISCEGKTFLVFEDNEINRMIAGNALETLGAGVEFAENGEIGVGRFLSNPEKYDLIFMDIQMPVMDGFEAAGKIRASETPNARTVPIIAMTANVFQEDVDRAMAAGMNLHIGKPFEMEQLQEAIRKMIF